jgi:gamma-glutamyltranspeptidase/glutathione hydrolase
MVATSHPAATLAGLEILKAGGNAIDAAIAACAVQGVVEPGSTGIGGDCFTLFAREGQSNVLGYNGSGRAPAKAEADWYRRNAITQIERQTPHAVTVPGSVEAWARLSTDHGRLSLAQLLRPAVSLARNGYAVTPRVAFDWANQAAALANDPHAARIFLPGGRPPQIGEVHRQLELAATLEAIGEHGPDEFYKGRIMEDMIERLQELGGLHTREDFAEAAGEYVTPISTNYRGFDVHECPPNGQGVAALIMLNILSGFDLPNDPLSPERLHLEIEAGRLAYSMRDALVADPASIDVPTDWMLSKPLTDALRGRIDPNKALTGIPAAPLPPHKDTVYIAVVDRDRNAVSFINSLFEVFGSTIVTPRSGVMLNSRGEGFVTEEGHPNCIAGRKRPLNTIIPGMVTKDGRAVMPFGVMGGQYQAMGHAAFLTRVIDDGLDLQTAIDLPRVAPVPGTDQVESELTYNPSVIADLVRRGFEMKPTARPIGGAQAIWIDWENGTLLGGSDPRKDGCALGY